MQAYRDKLKLNIGAGATYLPGFVNVDISEKADLTLDLNKDRLPFDDSSVGLIFSYHCLEHVENYLFALQEIYRVLNQGGILLLGVPYVTLTEVNLVNPYHKVNFNEHSFKLFDYTRRMAAAETDVFFQTVGVRIHHMGSFKLLPWPLKTWCRRHLFNTARKIDFVLVARKPPFDPVPAIDRRNGFALFDECLQARIPHEGSGQACSNKGALPSRTLSLARWWRGHESLPWNPRIPLRDDRSDL
jgi:predicted SAM-dependent methyltransferase